MTPNLFFDILQKDCVESECVTFIGYTARLTIKISIHIINEFIFKKIGKCYCMCFFCLSGIDQTVVLPLNEAVHPTDKPCPGPPNTCVAAVQHCHI